MIDRDGKDSDIKWKTKLGDDAQNLVNFHGSNIRSTGNGSPYNIPTFVDEMSGKEIRDIMTQIEEEKVRLKYMLHAIIDTQRQIEDRFTKVPKASTPRGWIPRPDDVYDDEDNRL